MYKKTAFRRTFTSLVLLLSLVVSLILCELILRLCLSHQLLKLDVEPVTPPVLYKFDSVKGTSLKKNQKGSTNRLKSTVYYETDKDGHRVLGHTKAGSASCKTLALGDSNTFGFGINSEDLWLTKINQFYPQLSITNAGVSGYGLDQFYLQALEIKKENKIQPNIVILFIPRVSENRHMKKFIFGRGKPFFKKLKSDYELQTEHIERYNHSTVKSIYNYFPKSIQNLLIVRVANTLLKRMEERLKFYLLNPKFTQKESFDAAWFFIEKIKFLFPNTMLIFITGEHSLCDSEKIDECVYYNMDNFPLRGRNNENLNHISILGNEILADLIVNNISSRNLSSPIKKCFVGQ